MESIPVTPSSDALPGPPVDAARAPAVGAVLVGGDDDRRLLLRGILALEHHPVTFEGRNAEELEAQGPAPGSDLLVLDLATGAGPWADQLATALRHYPALRAVVVLPAGAPELEPAATHAGARATVSRPFTLRAFREAIAEALAFAPTGPP